MASCVWILKQASWSNDQTHAVFSTSKEANLTMKAIKAEAARHRVDPELPHELEQNLFLEKREVRQPGDAPLTLKDIR
jgi:hypothetical protein